MMSRRFLSFRRRQRASQRGRVAGYTTDEAYTLHRIKEKSDRNDSCRMLPLYKS